MSAQSCFAEHDWDIYAECYDALLHITPYQQLLHQARDTLQLHPNSRLLDLCCGTGNFISTLPCRDIKISGVDFSVSMLQRAQQKHPLVEFIHADVNKTLPFEDQIFDSVVSINALYALQNPEAILCEISRILIPEGTLVLATPKKGFDNGLILKAHAKSTKPDSFWQNPHTSPQREESLIREAVSDETLVKQMIYVAQQNRLIAGTSTFHFLSPVELTEMIRNAGFNILSVSPTYANQGTLVRAQKRG